VNATYRTDHILSVRAETHRQIFTAELLGFWFVVFASYTITLWSESFSSRYCNILSCVPIYNDFMTGPKSAPGAFKIDPEAGYLSAICYGNKSSVVPPVAQINRLILLAPFQRQPRLAPSASKR